MSPLFPPPKEEIEQSKTLAKLTALGLIVAGITGYRALKRHFANRNAKPS